MFGLAEATAATSNLYSFLRLIEDPDKYKALLADLSDHVTAANEAYGKASDAQRAAEEERVATRKHAQDAVDAVQQAALTSADIKRREDELQAGAAALIKESARLSSWEKTLLEHDRKQAAKFLQLQDRDTDLTAREAVLAEAEAAAEALKSELETRQARLRAVME